MRTFLTLVLVLGWLPALAQPATTVAALDNLLVRTPRTGEIVGVRYGLGTNDWGGMREFKNVATITGTTNLGNTFAAVGGTYWVATDKNAEVQDPRWFGAIGDGTTDDSAAIQACFNYSQGSVHLPWDSSPPTTNGRAIVFPAGQFRAEGLQIRNGIKVYGSTDGTMIRLKDGSTNDLMTSVDAANWTLRDIVLDGNNWNHYTTNLTGGGNVLSIYGSQYGLVRSLVQHVTIQHGNTNGLYLNMGGADCTFDGLIVQFCKGVGIMAQSCNDSRFSKLDVSFCTLGAFWQFFGANCTVTDSKFWANRALNNIFTSSYGIPSVNPLGSDDAAVIIAGLGHRWNNIDIQENFSIGMRIGTYKYQCSSSSFSNMHIDGNGGIDATNTPTANLDYQRDGVQFVNYYKVNFDGVIDDFRARQGKGRQRRGLVFGGVITQYTSNSVALNDAVLYTDDWYRIKDTSGGATFTNIQYSLTTKLNSTNDVFQAQTYNYGAVVPQSWGTNGTLESANDYAIVNVRIANQLNQNEGVDEGYAITTAGPNCVFQFDGETRFGPSNGWRISNNGSLTNTASAPAWSINPTNGVSGLRILVSGTSTNAYGLRVLMNSTNLGGFSYSENSATNNTSLRLKVGSSEDQVVYRDPDSGSLYVGTYARPWEPGFKFGSNGNLTNLANSPIWTVDNGSTASGLRINVLNTGTPVDVFRVLSQGVTIFDVIQPSTSISNGVNLKVSVTNGAVTQVIRDPTSGVLYTGTYTAPSSGTNYTQFYYDLTNTVVAGSGITVTPAAGKLTIAATAASGPTNGTMVAVDGTPQTTVNLADGAQVAGSLVGTNWSYEVVDGSLGTNELTGAAYAALIDRANHTGTQAISTVTNLQEALDAKQDASLVLTNVAALTGGTSTNFLAGDGTFKQVTTNDIPGLVALLSTFGTNSGTSTGGGGLLFASTVPVTVLASETNETDLITAVAAGGNVTNSLATGDVLQFDALGKFTATSSTWGAGIFRLYIGPSFVYTFTVAEPDSAVPTDAVWSMTAYLNVVAGGTNASVTAAGHVRMQAETLGDSGGYTGFTYTLDPSSSFGTLDTTVANVVRLTFENFNDGSSSRLDLTCTEALLRTLTGAGTTGGGGDAYLANTQTWTGTNTATGPWYFDEFNATTLNATNFAVGGTNVMAAIALKANALNPTTTGTFTHNGTNAIITSSNATFNIGKANALVIGTNGNVGFGTSPSDAYIINATGTSLFTTVRATTRLYSAGTADAASGSTAAVTTDGGGYFTKAVSASQLLIRSNAPSTAAARGANTLIQEFNTNQWRVIATGPTTNEMVLMTLNTNGIMALNGLRFNQTELQPFSAATNYVADFDGPTQQTILVTNLIANFLHATNVAAGKMRSFIIRAGTNATVTVVLPRPLWECNTNVATLAANQSLTLSLTGFGPDSNTNVNATIGPVYSR